MGLGTIFEEDLATPRSNVEEEKKEEEIIDEVSIRCKVDYGWMDRWMDGRMDE